LRLPSFILDLVTSRDGVSWDPIRVGVIISGASLIGLAGYGVIINKQPFDALSFGSGIGALMAGAGLGIGAKHKDEPDA
jgi:hypothetical protein